MKKSLSILCVAMLFVASSQVPAASQGDPVGRRYSRASSLALEQNGDVSPKS